MKSEDIEEVQPSETRRFWRRVQWFVVYPLLAIALLIAIVVGWLSARDSAALAEVDQQVTELRAQGLPVDNETLASYYEQQCSSKDADAWLNVLTVVESAEFQQAAKQLYPWQSDSAMPLPGEQWPEQEKVEQFLEQQQDLLRTAQRLAQADIKRRMPVTFDGIRTELKWAEKVRQLARLFELQAADAIVRRDSHTAADALLSSLGSARATEGQPCIIGQLIALSIESISLESLKLAIERNVLDADDLKRVQSRLEARSPWPTLWKNGIIGERAMMLPIFHEPARYLGEEYWRDALPSPWRGHDTLNFLDITKRSLELPTQDLDTFRAANRQETQEVEARLRSNGFKLDYNLCSYLLPAYGAYGEATVQREMRYRLANLAIGARLFQQQHGKLPDALEDLKQVGVDPAQQAPPGGKPFGFRKLDASRSRPSSASATRR